VDGEARELFINKGKCGIYFEPENAQILSSSIENLYHSPALCKELGDNGASFVKKNFDRENIAVNFLNVLKKL